MTATTTATQAAHTCTTAAPPDPGADQPPGSQAHSAATDTSAVARKSRPPPHAVCTYSRNATAAKLPRDCRAGDTPRLAPTRPPPLRQHPPNAKRSPHRPTKNQNVHVAGTSAGGYAGSRCCWCCWSYPPPPSACATSSGCTGVCICIRRSTSSLMNRLRGVRSTPWKRPARMPIMVRTVSDSRFSTARMSPTAADSSASDGTAAMGGGHPSTAVSPSVPAATTHSSWKSESGGVAAAT